MKQTRETYTYIISWFLPKLPKHFNRERKVFSANNAGTTGYLHRKKANFDLYLTPHKSINLWCIIDLNKKCLINKDPRRKQNSSFHKLEAEKYFLEKIQKVWAIKSVFDKPYFTQSKIFCSSKDNIKVGLPWWYSG